MATCVVALTAIILQKLFRSSEGAVPSNADDGKDGEKKEDETPADIIEYHEQLENAREEDAEAEAIRKLEVLTFEVNNTMLEQHESSF